MGSSVDWNESWVTVGTRLWTRIRVQCGEERANAEGRRRSRYKKSSRIRPRVARSCRG